MARTRKSKAGKTPPPAADTVTLKEMQALYLDAPPDAQEQLCLWLFMQPGSKAEWVWNELKGDIDREAVGRYHVAVALSTTQGKLSRRDEEDVMASEKQAELERLGLSDAKIADRLTVEVDTVRKRRTREGRKKYKRCDK